MPSASTATPIQMMRVRVRRAGASRLSVGMPTWIDQPDVAEWVKAA